ncbi:MAG: polysaccharide biosynthesis protein PslF [Frankiaceae bacterium]|nr:polysaccharide biosynthesis protein PslF [Frankiaceae bacterium]
MWSASATRCTSSQNSRDEGIRGRISCRETVKVPDVPVPLRVEVVVGRYRPDRDGVSGYVERLVAALPDVGVRASVTEWPGIRTWRPQPGADLVHVQFAPSAYRYSGDIGLLPIRSGLPVVTTLHEYGWWNWSPVPGWLPLVGTPVAALSRGAERTGRWDRETLLLAPASRALVVTGTGHADVVRERLRRNADVVPIGANVGRAYSRDRRSARAELQLAEDAPLLVFFGFVHPVKGLRYLLEAVAELRRTRPGLTLAVVGGWRSLAWPDDEADAFVAELREHGRALGLMDGGLDDDAVRFCGFLDEQDASRWLTAADVAVLPFTAGITAKSGSLLTCWTHGLPVVATEPPDGPDPDVTGAIAACRIRDTPTLRNALANVLDDRLERERLAYAGSSRMAGRSWPEVAHDQAELYRRVLG